HWTRHVSEAHKIRLRFGPAAIAALQARVGEEAGCVLDNLKIVRLGLLDLYGAVVEARDTTGAAMIAGRLHENLRLQCRLCAALASAWPAVRRPPQLQPPGDWRIWLLLAGRGFGKTRAGSEWVRAQIEAGTARRIALVAPTAADVRDVVVEGQSGILAVSPSWN